MFSLIITIISIALVAALALATIYYGGAAFTRGGDAAKASQLINEGQQLQGARTLAVADANVATASVASDLVNGLNGQKYLAQAPAGWDVTTNLSSGTAFVTSAAISDAVCKEVNAKATGTPVGTGTTIPATVPAGQVYACATTGASSANQVTYKF